MEEWVTISVLQFGAMCYDKQTDSVLVTKNTNFSWIIERPFPCFQEWFVLSHDDKYLFVDPHTRELKLGKTKNTFSVEDGTLYVNTKRWNMVYLDRTNNKLYDTGKTR